MIGKMLFGLNSYGMGHAVHSDALSKASFHIGTINEDQASILNWLKKNPGLMSVDEVLEGVSLDRMTVTKGVRHLVRTELVEIDVSKEGGVRRYQISKLLSKRDQEELISNRQVLGSYLNGAWQYGRMRLFDFIALLIAQMMIAQWSGMSGFGNVLILSLVVSVLSQIFALGLPNAMQVFLPTYTEDHDKPLFKGCFAYGMKYVCTTSIAMTLVCMFVVQFIPMDEEMARAYQWGLATIPFWSIWNMAVTPCMALKKWNSVTLPDYFVFPIMWIASLLVLHYGFGRSSVADIMMCRFIANIPPGLLQLFLTWRVVRNHCRGVTGTLEHERPGWWKKAWLLLSFKLIQTIRGSMLVLVGMLTMGAHAAGDLGVVNSALTPILVLRSIIQTSASPEIPRLFKSGLTESLHYLAHSMTAVGSIILLVVLPLALFFGKDLLALYGNNSEATHIVFIIFVCLEVVKSFFGFPPLLLQLTSYQTLSILLSLLAIATFSVLVLILVVPFRGNIEIGVIMIGIALAANRFTYIFGCWVLVLRKLGLSTATTALFIPEHKRHIERLVGGSYWNEDFRVAELKSLGQYVPIEEVLDDEIQDSDPAKELDPD